MCSYLIECQAPILLFPTEAQSDLFSDSPAFSIDHRHASKRFETDDEAHAKRIVIDFILYEKRLADPSGQEHYPRIVRFLDLDKTLQLPLPSEVLLRLSET